MVEGARELSGVSFISTLMSFLRALPSCPQHLPKTTLLIASYWGLGFNMGIFGGWRKEGNTNIQSTAVT